MSYQTVADVFVGSQNNFDYQKKDLLKDSGFSSLSSSSKSFGDLVSYYKSESNVNSTGSAVNSNIDNSNSSVKDETISSDVKERTDNSDVNGKDAVKDSAEETSKASGSDSTENTKEAENVNKSENTEKSDKKEDVAETSGENEENAEKLNKNKLKVSEKTEGEADNLKENGKKAGAGKDEKAGRKLSDKDFSRMHHLVGEAANGAAGTSGANAANTEAELKVSEKDEKSADLEKIKNNKKAGKGKAGENIKAEAEDEENENLKLEEALKNAGAEGQAANSKNVSDSDEDSKLKFKDEDELGFGKTESEDKIYMDKDKKILVNDLRTEKVSGEQGQEEAGDASKPKMKVSEPKLINNNTALITMEASQNVNANVLSSNGQTASANGSNFQAMLNNQIQQSAPEFVKAGNLVLKDNNQGTINLLLRPDELGNVKLHLTLDGKNISGHITVATREAMEVFKDNAETLREAFIKSGFDSASFDVSYGGQNGSGQEMAFDQQQDGSDFVAKKVYESHSENGDGEFDKIVEKNDKNKDYSINIVA